MIRISSRILIVNVIGKFALSPVLPGSYVPGSNLIHSLRKPDVEVCCVEEHAHEDTDTELSALLL